jgi:hypothetical protein
MTSLYNYEKNLKMNQKKELSGKKMTQVTILTGAKPIKLSFPT